MGRLTAKRFTGAAGLEFVLFLLPADQAMAFCAWDIENDGWLQVGGIHRKSKGYIGQEVEKLMAMIHGP